MQDDLNQFNDPDATPPESENSSGMVDPPILDKPVQMRRAVWQDPVEDIARWIDETLGKESYGAPRVFDLYTLLAITLAFAILFAALRLVEPLLDSRLPEVAISIGTFVTLTAIAQLGLWNGKKPRIASLVAGPAIWLLIGVVLVVLSPRMNAGVGVLIGLVCSSIMGIPAGYLGGATVAGVFLVAEKVRARYSKPPDELSVSGEDADAIFSNENLTDTEGPQDG